MKPCPKSPPAPCDPGVRLGHRVHPSPLTAPGTRLSFGGKTPALLLASVWILGAWPASDTRLGALKYYVCPTLHTTYRLSETFRGLLKSAMSISFLTLDNILISVACVKRYVCTLHTRLMLQCFTMNLCQRLSIHRQFHSKT